MISHTVEDICTIISIVPVAIEEYKPLVPTHYSIKPCRDMHNSAECLIVRRGSFRVYIDENRPALIIPEPADVIAGAVCRDFKIGMSNFQNDFAEPGLFWVRGGYQKKEILKAEELREPLERAKEKQTEWFKRLIKDADDAWAQNRMRREISDLQRLACQQLGLTRDWDIDMEVSSRVRMVPCKFCRADIHPESVVCMHCRGVLNMEKFRTEFISADSFAKPS